MTPIKSGTTKSSTEKSNMILNNSLPRKTLDEVVTSFSVSAVCVSSSRTKICAKPDMEEKNKMIHNSAESISGPAEKAPMEKETAVRVTIANRKIAFSAYLVLNSCCMSFLKISQALPIDEYPHIRQLQIFGVISCHN